MFGVLSAASLGPHGKAVQRLTGLWPSAWHIIVATDDMCRAEQIERIRRGLEEKRWASTEVSTDYSEQKPWSACFRIAAFDTHF